MRGGIWWWPGGEFKLGKTGDRAVGRPVPTKCKHCGFVLGHDEGWCDRICDHCRDKERRERAERDSDQGDVE